MGFAVVKMQRLVHDFVDTRTWLSVVIGMALLSAVVVFVQGSIISQSICSYTSQP